ncbi:hypothetical protein [Lyngbya aestuarii]|uniref:hypothetical protein n=1 Tax=Lyngbya aestuarii TaxID=118322 RepID=UPI00403DC306
MNKDDLSDGLISLSPTTSQSPISQAEAQELENRAVKSGLGVSFLPKLPPILTGMGAGMTTFNGVAITVGLYSLFNATPANTGFDLLDKATEQYKSGNFEEAIALADSIEQDSSAYEEAVIFRQKWRQEWDTGASQFEAVKQAFNEGRWQDLLEEARQTPNVEVWQRKIAPFVIAAKPQLENEAKNLLQQAYQQAAQKNFTEAIVLLKKISPETSTGAQIKPKLTEYQQKQEIKAKSLLQKAYGLAVKRDFIGAQKYLSEIPQNTAAYETAKVKLAEYSQKQNSLEEVERQAKLRKAAETQKRLSESSTNKPAEAQKKSSAPSTNKPKNSQLNPGGQLQEVKPQPPSAAPVLQ